MAADHRQNGHQRQRLHRVVVTGVGCITPVGHNADETWTALKAGQTGFGPFTLVKKGEHSSGGVCEVKSFDPTQFLDRRDARRRDRFEQMATIAANEAMRQANLPITDENREHIGIFAGTGVGGINTLVDQEHTLVNDGPRRLSPFAITMIMPNGAAGMLAIDYGIQGPSTTITTACASGNDAIGYAFKALRQGELVAALTGGTEATITGVALGGFERANATSTRESETPRPFDKERDGLIMGEGAGFLVLETLEHALARGAHILAEIVGYGQTTDAYHITAPAEGGRGAARAMQLALYDAGMEPRDIGYINAHGTGTHLNDKTETEAIKAVFGEVAYSIPVSSTKSMTGHIMGATGAIESVIATYVLRDQIVPPTINYKVADPECDLDYVPNVARATPVEAVMNNAFGFGGHNGVLIFKRYTE
ncbi:MAG: beta-ketoacyl-ACP synthase II [Anaerolineales bacterium]|nr:beta-ketoacyl-ACP synthase II [Anaerolineales bacterium]MCB0010757.1 beta-ketoacyl-ACP synthase II [Anaerolineales bacterium]MCB0017507.1 beta-ketoacyl-ACP synthase II [Anaerolineales bacterium]MCB0029218.1 beta-ketoacyl-ACP synthase II [Anaerolineales bacterium]MCB8959172.1 beta-ketoacyl-ACP synthase II [Ardenticatenales bacterium]